MKHFSICLAALLALAVAASSHAEWKPAEGPLMTRWAKQVSPDNALPEYPRPQMVRQAWQNLNGLWDYQIQPRDDAEPKSWAGDILVPFPVESALSGVMKPVGKDNRLWYRRAFDVPGDWSGQRILLHFGAVDWETTVWLNGTKLGTHKGGFDPFTFDITKALKPGGPQELVLSVWDPTNDGPQPRGKQVKNPSGIYYTPVTGIWQTVWLEPVPAASIAVVEPVPDIDTEQVTINVKTSGAKPDDAVRVTALADGKPVAEATAPVGKPVVLKIADAKLWWPESPFLYDLKVELLNGGKPVDEVQSYFGMRKTSLGKDDKGITRLMLNNKFVFQYGPLDQGWWPDGLYTAPTDEALRYDLEVLKRLGCNMLRKHVKVEPQRLYYWCDKLGLLVWQDMPSGDRGIHGDQPDLKRTPESAAIYERELKAMIDAFRVHPCIVMWVPFNEGWGQFDTARIVDWTKKYDPTRVVNNASGWTDRGVGDVNDMHRYPGPGMPNVEEDRAVVLGEFGGLGLPIEGHLWWNKKNWGYRNFRSTEDLNRAYLSLMQRLRPLVDAGLSAAVYTQTTDVEGEVNGMMTYDREVLKFDEDKLCEAHQCLPLPPPVAKTVIATSQQRPQSWHYTTTQPADGWQQPDFDDSAWQEGQGGFGLENTPGAVVRTKWNTPDIWLRRTFEIDKPLEGKPGLQLHHDEDVEVYLNGKLVFQDGNYTTDYIHVTLNNDLPPGRYTMAVHCHQTMGGQYIDVGVVEFVEPK